MNIYKPSEVIGGEPADVERSTQRPAEITVWDGVGHVQKA
jgi:hypothetical protein